MIWSLNLLYQCPTRDLEELVSWLFFFVVVDVLKSALGGTCNCSFEQTVNCPCASLNVESCFHACHCGFPMVLSSISMPLWYIILNVFFRFFLLYTCFVYLFFFGALMMLKEYFTFTSVEQVWVFECVQLLQGIVVLLFVTYTCFSRQGTVQKTAAFDFLC